MSNLRSESKVSLSAIAPEPTTEIFVVDSSFRRVASGLGRLETDVEPGIYKVRFRSGPKQRDELVEVVSGQPSVHVTTGPLGFSSAAPINDTRTSREYHQYSASVESLNVHQHLGKGSQLFVYTRDLLKESTDVPWTGVSIHDVAGNLIAEMKDGIVDTQYKFAALNIELDPGTYRLRVESGALGTFEMFLITSADWQTQVFLMAADFQAGDRTARRAALKTASISMNRLGNGFQPGDDKFRLAELARQGLATGRNVVNRESLSELLWGKYENPMMGIYGGHLLLLSHRPNHELIEEVVSNLDKLLGAHADVESLKLRSGGMRTYERLKLPTPPMQFSSWDLIVKQSFKRLGTVPQDSVTASLADGLLSSTPWLLHRLPEIARGGRSAQPMNFARTQRVLEQLVAFGEGEGREVLSQARRDRESFSPLERKIMNATLDAAEIREFSSWA
jgi:hypothetical protein